MYNSGLYTVQSPEMCEVYITIYITSTFQEMYSSFLTWKDVPKSESPTEEVQVLIEVQVYSYRRCKNIFILCISRGALIQANCQAVDNIKFLILLVILNTSRKT